MSPLRRRRSSPAHQGRSARLVLLAAALGLVVGLTDARNASSAGVLTILSAEHDPGGRITVSVASSDPAMEVTQVTARVDGLPRPAEITRRPSLPASIVIAIDTSGSMLGEPMVAAREAAIALTQRLSPSDQVAVVAFADAPTVLSSFEAGQQAAVDQLTSLQAGGNTALFGAIDQSLALLADRSGVRALVVLSDGEDHVAGDTLLDPEQRRSDSMASVATSGVSVYAFALGDAADHDFLQAAASSSGGDFWSVTENAALNELFTHLGSHLGSSTEVSITVPPLSRGTHALELRGMAAGEPVVGTFTVPVTNSGLLSASARPMPEVTLDRPFVIDVASPAPGGSLRYEATAGGQPVTVLDQPARVALDPWAFAPGQLDVEIVAFAQDTVVASTSITVDIPALTPQLAVDVQDARGGREALVRGRVQQDPDARIEAALGTDVIAQGAAPELRVPLPEEGGALVVRLLSSGQEVATSAQAIPAQAVAADSMPLPLIGGVMAAMAAVALLSTRVVRRRRRGDQPEDWRPSGQTMLVGRRAISTTEAHRPRGTVVVRPPGGEERSYEICRAPLSLGSSEACDIVITDRAAAPVHARLYALGDGEFRIHGIAPRGTPFQESHQDEWMLVRHGEQIAIGEHLLTVLNIEDSQPAAGRP